MNRGYSLIIDNTGRTKVQRSIEQTFVLLRNFVLHLVHLSPIYVAAGSALEINTAGKPVATKFDIEWFLWDKLS